MTRMQLIDAVKVEQRRVGDHQVYPPLERFNKTELTKRLAELRGKVTGQ